MTTGYRVTFADPEDSGLPSEDGQAMRFRFTVVPSEFAGTPRERDSTGEHELIVRLSESRAKSWGLDPPRRRAVMVHAAVEHVLEAGRHGEFPPSAELRIDTETFPGSLPEHFDRPMTIAGSSIEVERAGPP
ncbi:MAG TPA: hypothetical protein VFS34_01055 [Thermoanaerobaculia bacterium]|nr:hypothetical protein [Thermoanaerobaculia bacterium]